MVKRCHLHLNDLHTKLKGLPSRGGSEPKTYSTYEVRLRLRLRCQTNRHHQKKMDAAVAIVFFLFLFLFVPVSGQIID